MFLMVFSFLSYFYGLFMNWRDIDERLIKRGELLFSLDFLDGYDDELRKMNMGKEGGRFRLTNSYILFLVVVRYIYGFPYRQFEGFMRGLHRLIPKLLSGDYSGLRRRILRLYIDLYKDIRSMNLSLSP